MTGKKTTQNSGNKNAKAASKTVKKTVNDSAAKTKSAAKTAASKKSAATKNQRSSVAKQRVKATENDKKEGTQNSGKVADTNTGMKKEPAQTQNEVKKSQSTKSSNNTAQNKKVVAEKQPEVVTVSEKRGNNGISWLAVLLGLGGLGLAGYTYMNTQVTSSKSEGALTRLDDFSNQTSEIRQSNDKLQSSISDLGGQIAGFDSRLESIDGRFADVEKNIGNVVSSMDENVAQLQQSVAAVEQGVDSKFNDQVATLEADYGRIASAMSQFQLKEVEAIVSIAQERLILGQDVDSAVRALTVADAKIAEIGDSQLLTVRQQIQAAKAELEKLEPANVSDLVTRLAGAEQGINNLPLAELGKLEPTAASVTAEAGNQTATTEQAEVAESVEETQSSGEWWKSLDGVASKAKGALNSAGSTIAMSLEDVVVVHDLSETATPLMVPEQRYFLKENLRMAVQNIEYALIRGYEEAAKASAASAKNMLSQYYVGDNPKVQELNALLSEVEEIQLNAEIPDISATVDAVRAAANQASQ